MPPTVAIQAMLSHPPTGVTTATLGFQRVLASLGLHYSVSNIAPQHTRAGRLRLELRAILVMLRGGRNQVVYRTASGGLGRLLDIPALLLARMFTSHPPILHHHTISYLQRRDFLTRLVIRAAGTRTAHFVLCERMQSLVHTEGRTGPAFVVSNSALTSPNDPAMDTAATDLPVQTLRAGLNVGFLGNPIAEKGLDDFLTVASRIGNRHTWTVAGIRRSEVASAPDHVEFLGWLDADHRQSFLSQIDVLIFPSRYRYETRPMVIEEALGAGVFVLAYNVGCIPEQLRSSEDGLVLEDLDEIASLLRGSALLGPVSPIERRERATRSSDRRRAEREKLHRLLETLLRP